MPRIVRTRLLPIAFVGDDVASSVGAVVAAVVQLLDLMGGVALLAVVDAGCIARCIFQTLGYTRMQTLLQTSKDFAVLRKMMKPYG